MNSGVTRLTISWSKETDLALRSFLSAQGAKTGGFSKFIEEAVRWRMFDHTAQTVKARNAHIDPDELQAIIDEAVKEVREEMAEECGHYAAAQAP